MRYKNVLTVLFWIQSHIMLISFTQIGISSFLRSSLPIGVAQRITALDSAPSTSSTAEKQFLPLDVALLKTTESHNQTVREYISHLVSQLETFREVSKTHLERNQTAMKQRYDDKTTEVQYEVYSYSSQRHNLDSQRNFNNGGADPTS